MTTKSWNAKQMNDGENGSMRFKMIDMIWSIANEKPKLILMPKKG